MYKSNSPNNNRLTDLPDLFSSYSSMVFPRTIEEIFRWADRLWLTDGLYSQAIKKCVRYFLTDIELSGDGLGHETRKKYHNFLADQVNVLDEMAQVGDDLVAYGNSFTSISVPTARQLICPQCGMARPLRNLDPNKDYKWKNYTFTGDCPACKARGITFNRVDTSRVTRFNCIRIIRWAPQDIIINHNPVSGESEYRYDIPGSHKKKIQDGDHLTVATIPWEFVEAVKDDRLFKFSPDTFCHLRCGTAANLSTSLGGWGLPLFMSSFRQVIHLQMLERSTEAIAMDHIMPFRVLSPPRGGSGAPGDPLRGNLGTFANNVKSMLKDHRRDPTQWAMLPFPLEYQALGGDASKIVPVELMERAQDVLLTSMGVPQEFYRGSLHGGAAPPIGLRMFEKTWTHYTTQLDYWLNWFIDQCGLIMGWEGNITGRLERTSILEDDMGKQVKLQLAAAKVISNRTALQAFDIDVDREREQILEEDRLMNEQLMEEQRRGEQTRMLSDHMAPMPPVPQQGQGQPTGGGMPPGQGMIPPGMGGGGAPMSPSVEDIMGEAEMAAQQLMSSDPTTRRNTLRDMKGQNPTLHAQVKQMLADMEQGVKSDALAQAKMQASQGGGGGPM